MFLCFSFKQETALIQVKVCGCGEVFTDEAKYNWPKADVMRELLQTV